MLMYYTYVFQCNILDNNTIYDYAHTLRDDLRCKRCNSPNSQVSSVRGIDLFPSSEVSREHT